jgi:general secretion pathway protein D
MKKTQIFTSIVMSMAVFLAGCAATDDGDRRANLRDSYLKGDENEYLSSDQADTQDVLRTETGFSVLDTMNRGTVSFSENELARSFSAEKFYQVAAKDMPIEDFLHYSLGELLGVNYLLTPQVRNIKDNVTLNISDRVSARRLFQLVEQLLEERNLMISLTNDVYVIAKRDSKSKPTTQVGVGRDVSDVPASSGEIMQIVPILYGVKTNLKNTVEQLTDIQITIDVKQSALFVKGTRANIVRALELIQLLDSPATRGRHVGLVQLAFIDAGLYLDQISVLLENEGIPNSINSPENNNLVFVPLYQIGAVAIFAATEELLNRVKFWTRTLDKPSEGDVKQYYVYYPKYARATDIGTSLKPLMDASYSADRSASQAARNNRDDSEGPTSGQLTETSRSVGAKNDKMTFVVDERSNALVFYSTGTDYKNIVPLIQKLDVLPKQVLLEVVIVEVLLTDSFRYGVEWALQEGDVNVGTDGAFDVADIGGLSIFSGGTGDMIRARFFADKQNVNILSRPSVLVRDGVTANIDVGASISVQGAVTTNPDGNAISTSREYLKTGIKVSVTPTVNAQGVVIMTIDQSLSNEVEGSGGAGGNPNIFERNLSTEVVAESGQTIMLAGLIDEQQSEGANKVPGLGDLPLVGGLFKSKTQSNTKKELVLMITPKVINRSEQWGDIMSKFREGLSGIDI